MLFVLLAVAELVSVPKIIPQVSPIHRKLDGRGCPALPAPMTCHHEQAWRPLVLCSSRTHTPLGGGSFLHADRPLEHPLAREAASRYSSSSTPLGGGAAVEGIVNALRPSHTR